MSTSGPPVILIVFFMDALKKSSIQSKTIRCIFVFTVRKTSLLWWDSLAFMCVNVYMYECVCMGVCGCSSTFLNNPGQIFARKSRLQMQDFTCLLSPAWTQVSLFGRSAINHAASFSVHCTETHDVSLCHYL